MTTLAVDIGNHRTKIALISQGDEIVHRRHFLTVEIEGQLDAVVQMLDESSADGIAIGSVVPTATELLLGALTKYKPLVVTGSTPCELTVDYTPAESLGADRLAAAVGAYREYGKVIKKATMIVDAGSTITADIVGPAGTYRGGAILPCEELSLRALHDGAAQLPKVEFKPPQIAIGSNTEECMLVGVKALVIGAIEKLYSQYGEAVGEHPFLVLTGASAAWIATELQIPHMVDPDVVLLGLSAIWSFNNE